MLRIAAFFSEDKPKKREEVRRRMQALVEADLKIHGFLSLDSELDLAIRELSRGNKGITPFHWELEFPEVFATDENGNVSGGFDIIVGNPPFAGKNTLLDANREGYLDWLKTLHDQSHGNSDLVAHFFRRAFSLLRLNGCFGLIATNTISQGDTRFTGLRWICTNGGTIYRALKRLPWPGEAAVTVSAVHVLKGIISAPRWLDGRSVEQITAYLFHAFGHDDPERLLANKDKAFEGVKISGSGFTFDDNEKGLRRGASPLSDMNRLILKDARNAERIFPYLGGDEVNTSPTHAHDRFVISFEDYPLKRANLGRSWTDSADKERKAWLRSGVVPLDYPGPVAEDWPDLLKVVEERVRRTRNNEKLEETWWRFERVRPGLSQALRGVSNVFAVNCGASPHLAIARVSVNQVFAHSLVLFTTEGYGSFAVLQSRVHELWVWFMASSLEDRLRYAHSDCFETFPFPSDQEGVAALSEVGLVYCNFRSKVMIGNNEGLTKTYNRLHSPEEDSPDISQLRELHNSLDRAVLDAYGWTDIKPKCEFFPEFEDEDEEDENGRQRKKKYRYRWPDEIRDDVLARLLELNRRRAVEEGQAVEDEAAVILDAKPKTNNKKRKAKKAMQDSTSDMFEMDHEEA